ncbi:acyltransferase-like protein, chloroplastic [Heracleum sosnowskyi]|uniref:Acyltransferase-like protein, chloroplastic n=1 Tax=Heracleum sosnowskyi TaxID=360622 RepID=A0AAD8H7C6_9APIA|nr:acyltransferase-like protein, chloroplastic [Heracleum sosnowskyi]
MRVDIQEINRIHMRYRVFEVWCLHIPFDDRTPFEGLVKFVENTIRQQHSFYPHKPIYIVGDSFGGCIALAVASSNPSIDLILILVNPATSFDKSPLKRILSIGETFADEFESVVPYILSIVLGDPLKAGMVNIKSVWPIRDKFGKFFNNIIDVMPSIHVLADNIPRGTFQWKLNLQKASDIYLKPRLHTVKAEVLVLARLSFL